VHVQTNWWEHFFEGLAVSMWLQAIPATHTQNEAERIARLLALSPGADVLDVPCGAGRLSLTLGARGYHVTGVDWSSESLAYAQSLDAASSVSWHRREMRDLPWPARFDGAFCVGNSFGYLDEEGNAAFLRAVRASLKPGARFVLETPMVLENLLHRLQARPWWKVGDIHLLVENQYDQTTSRLDIEYTFVSNGRIEVRRGSHRAYPYRELFALLASCGFSVETAEPWSREAHSVWFVATRV
jgi:SAM-dependent methyltransferase